MSWIRHVILSLTLVAGVLCAASTQENVLPLTMKDVVVVGGILFLVFLGAMRLANSLSHLFEPIDY